MPGRRTFGAQRHFVVPRSRLAESVATWLQVRATMGQGSRAPGTFLFLVDFVARCDVMAALDQTSKQQVRTHLGL